MKQQEYFFTAQPVVTDDEGHLGCWHRQDFVYTEPNFGMSDFDQFIKTDSLFYTPDEYVEYLKEKGFALEAPEEMHEIKTE